jgi:hypothetical protein
MEQRNKITQIILVIGSLTGWFAVIVQFYLIIVNRAATVTETIIRYFSFYTILTNILAAFCLTICLLSPSSYLGRFFLRRTTVTAIAVYITVVGLVYNLILRALWKPEGMQRLVDELLHTIIPILFIVYWFLSKPKSGVQWKSAFPWLAYPLLYLVFVLARGEMSGYYPYPFIAVTSLGYDQVLLNCFFLFLGFLVISFVFIAINKMAQKRVADS